MGFARKIGSKLRGFGERKIREYKDERAFHAQEKAVYKQAERKGRLARAAKEGYKSGRTKSRSKLARASSIIRTDGPDPFGFFQSSKPRQKTRRKRSGTTIIIKQGSSRRRKKRSSQSYFDQLL
jgi:hypothetical protein